MKEIKVNRTIAVIGLIAFFILLIALGFLTHEFFFKNHANSTNSVSPKTESSQSSLSVEKVSTEQEISQTSKGNIDQQILLIEEYKITEDGNYLRATGSVKNIGQEPVESFVVVLSLLSPSGNVLKTVKSEQESGKLMPGDSFSFSLKFVPPPGPEPTKDCKISFEKATGEKIMTRPENPVVSIQGLAVGPWMLSETEIMEAIQAGQGIGSDLISYYEYLKDHNYIYYAEGGGAPKSEIIVLTPYSNVLTKAWQSKRNYEPYSLEKAKEDALSVYSNFPLSISFLVTVNGLSSDFAKSLKAVILKPDGSVVHPIGSVIPPLATYDAHNSSFPYFSSCIWVFDSMELGNREKVTFVLIRELGEQRAEIDFTEFK